MLQVLNGTTFALPFLRSGVFLQLITLPYHGSKEMDHFAVVEATTLTAVFQIVPSRDT